MAKDSAHEFSDAEIRAFEREVEGVYGEASKTAYANLKRYLAQFEADDEKMRERLEAGEITKAQYRSWRSGKIAAGRRYRIVLKQCAEAMTRANVVAAAAIEGRLPEVYAENYNYGTWQVESAVGVDTAYALQDASTVQRLLADHGSYLPKPSVNVAKDMAWNRRLIANQITQGVLLGESIPKIAKRMQDVTGANRAAAVRLARTSTTAAENAGRVDSYKRAKGLGIKVQQEWLATMDGRTRSSHRQLDGEKVEVGEKFSNGCRYPGDPEAPYAETCNCRCTLIAAVEGVDYSDGKRWSRLPEGMTYEEWKAGKPAVTGAKPADRTISEFMGMPGTKRKLDTAGVSVTEARKKLTEQLKEYGIPCGSFRKMSAGDQQKVLDAALARNFANGARGGNRRKLTDAEVETVRAAANELSIPTERLTFNSRPTGYSMVTKKVNVGGDVFPDEDSTNNRDRLSVKAVLAHEYYGHAAFPDSSYPIGHWADEFRASYHAAMTAPGLSDEERASLMVDAYQRASEAGVKVRYTKSYRKLVYGY